MYMICLMESDEENVAKTWDRRGMALAAPEKGKARELPADRHWQI